MKHIHGIWLIMVCCVCALVTTGCRLSPDMNVVVRELHTQLRPFELQSVCTLSLGKISLFFLRKAVSLDESSAETAEILREVDKVRLGIYERKSPLTSLPNNCLSTVEQRMKHNNWELLLRVRDKEEITLIYYQLEKGAVQSLSVIALSGDELVLVELEGDFDKIIQKTLIDQKNPITFG